MINNLKKIAKISAAHGIKGQNKLIILLENKELIKNLNYFDEKGNKISFKINSINNSIAIVSIENISNRNDAEKMIGKFIYTRKEDLPKLSDSEIYYDDLMNLKVKDQFGEIIGTVFAVLNFGSGDIIEIEFINKNKELFPFTDQIFPEINIKQGFLTFIKPEYL